MKRLFIAAFAVIAALTATAKDYVLNTPNTSLILTVVKDKPLYFRYYGSKADCADISAAGRMVKYQAYPAFGTSCSAPYAALVKQANGDNSASLVVEKSELTTEGHITTLSVWLKDVAHENLVIKVNYAAYDDCDIVKINAEYFNNGKKPIVLQKYMSAVLPIQSDNCVLLQLEGTLKDEVNESIIPLPAGQHNITTTTGSRVAHFANASFMLGLDGRLEEQNCPVIAGTLAWMGNSHIEFYNTPAVQGVPTLVMGGINPSASDYTLAGKSSLTTPEMIFTYATNGKGEATRSLHRWARRHQLLDGTKTREVLLNSWEGVHYDTREDNMTDMTRDFAQLGGEMFVVDDGWFGNNPARDSGKTSLGDWDICTKKLPNGIRPLIDLAHNNGMKFGIWIEPEMVNLDSDLYRAHPDWVLRHPDFDPTYGRGGGQMLLDLTNPEVQDFVFGVVDNLMTAYPDIYYIKWDNNMTMNNAHSLYLKDELQSNLYVDFALSLEKILKRIRAKYPELIIQLCASGGGRLNYGFMPYFQEMWTSDQTDAYHRILIQWGSMNFYPSNMLAAHVGSAYSKYTQRLMSIKFRFDVASMCRLGMEMVPAKLNDAEREYAKRAIAEYKNIRPVVQQGDLYRIVSPYEGNRDFTSLMYVTENKDRAVFFAYRHLFKFNMSNVIFRLQGLNPDAKYTIREVAPEVNGKPVSISGKTISGRTLMNEGIVIPELVKGYTKNAALGEVRAGNDFRSVILELVEVK